MTYINLRRILSQAALIIGVVIFSLGLQTFAAFSQPSTAPPNANAYAPITTGPTGQIKSGNLQVNALGIQGTGNALLVPNGNVGIGTASPGARLSVAGGIQLGNDTGPCTASRGGTLKWVPFGSGGTLFVCNLLSWRTVYPVPAGSAGISASAAVYSCPAMVNGCASTCSGNLSLNSTCSYTTLSTGGSRGSLNCNGSVSLACTLVGHLVP